MPDTAATHTRRHLPERPEVLWGISFDATPISGVVVEFLELARQFHARGHTVHLDLGYDVKEDKGNVFRPYTNESTYLPEWIRLSRVHGLAEIPRYGPGFIRETRAAVRGEITDLPADTAMITAELTERIVTTWRQLGVDVVIVENGTLPENIAFTCALRRAIDEYGRLGGLGKYVLWRDHDLMWSSEPGSGKYGAPPYPLAVRPTVSPYVHHLVLHSDDRERMLKWAPGLREVEVLPNTFRHREDHAPRSRPATRFRRRFGIPSDGIVIARCTRIIPQKRIDRDIDLLAALGPELARRGTDRPAYLFLAGDPAEAPAETAKLRTMARAAGVQDRVIFGGPLAPSHSRPVGDPSVATVDDLLAAADLASFLTSYDYESYGNPIGEAIAAGVPYVTTRYQAYDVVYGDRGLHAPVLETDADDDGPVTAQFVSEAAELLVNPVLRARVRRANLAVAERHFAAGKAGALVDRFLAETPASTTPASTTPATAPPTPLPRPASAADLPPLGFRTRLSVVVPVFNEAATIERVLTSLAGQRAGSRPMDRELYEIIVVDNNSSDDTVARCRAFAARNPEPAVHVISEPEQGVSCARRAGMDVASARDRDRAGDGQLRQRFYLVSADADCTVDENWLWELLIGMDEEKSAIGVCNYYYDHRHFAGRPRLWDAIDRTLRCRAVTFSLFGGFPDGKGFAVDREMYDRVGGIEISYQMQDGRFVSHLSDDWDFGIAVRAYGGDIGYLPRARVRINPRRVDHAIDEVIVGRAYGTGGIITMRDIRVDAGTGAHDGAADDAAPRPADTEPPDLTEAEAETAWDFSIKDFLPKNVVLPVLLTPSLLDDDAVIDFFGPALAGRLRTRIAEIMAEMHLTDLIPIHSYKTPSFRLYFEFADELFARLRATVGPDIGYRPPLPDCLQDVKDGRRRDRFVEFVRYYCEDRESGEAHNYFGNGGVF